MHWPRHLITGKKRRITTLSSCGSWSEILYGSLLYKIRESALDSRSNWCGRGRGVDDVSEEFHGEADKGVADSSRRRRSLETETPRHEAGEEEREIGDHHVHAVTRVSSIGWKCMTNMMV